MILVLNLPFYMEQIINQIFMLQELVLNVMGEYYFSGHTDVVPVEGEIGLLIHLLQQNLMEKFTVEDQLI